MEQDYHMIFLKYLFASLVSSVGNVPTLGRRLNNVAHNLHSPPGWYFGSALLTRSLRSVVQFY